MAISRDRLTELLKLPQLEQGSEVGFDESNDRMLLHGGRLPIVNDAHSALLSLDASALIEGHGGGLRSTLSTVDESSGEDVKRRSFLLGAAFMTGAFVEAALFALTTPPVADVARYECSRRVGMTDVQILADNVTHLRRMDFRYGSGRIWEQAVQLLRDEGTSLLQGSYSDSTGRALLTAVAQATRLAASTAADVNRNELAQRYYIEALNLAMRAGNQLFAAHILGGMSRLTIQNATRQRCARRAVMLAQAGKIMAGKAPATLAAQLNALEARGHALCRNTSAARSAVLEAERHYEQFRSGSEPAWLSFYTEAELHADLGRALRDINEPAHSTRLLTHTLAGYEPWRVRSRCFVQTDLATAYLIEGDHEHAVAITRDALNTARKVSSGRAVGRIWELQQQIRQLRSVKLTKLDEEIAEFLRHVHDDRDFTDDE